MGLVPRVIFVTSFADKPARSTNSVVNRSSLSPSSATPIFFPRRSVTCDDRRVHDQIPGRPLGLIHDRFERRAFHRRSKPASARAAVIHVAANQGRDTGRAADDDRLIFQALVFEESFRIG